MPIVLLYVEKSIVDSKSSFFFGCRVEGAGTSVENFAHDLKDDLEC